MPWPKGVPHSAETRAKMSTAHRGRRLSDEHRAKLSESARQRKTPPLTQEHREHLSEAMRSAARRGPTHPMWKDGGLSYSALHGWLIRNKPRTRICQQCGSGPRHTHFANVSGEYRRDVDDFIELCVSCHIAFDKARREAERIFQEASVEA